MEPTSAGGLPLYPSNIFAILMDLTISLASRSVREVTDGDIFHQFGIYAACAEHQTMVRMTSLGSHQLLFLFPPIIMRCTMMPWISF